MAQEFKLELDKRTETGRKAAKNYRSGGSIPGIFYSAEHEAVPFVIDRGHLHRAFQSDTHVYAVSVKGKKLHAIFKEIQYHPVTEEIVHVDLFGVSLKDKIDIVVPIVVEGEAAGVKTGGILNQNITELQIYCLATEVPDAVHIDVDELEVGDSIHVEELDLEGIEIVTNPEITIVSVQAPKEEVIEEPALEEELEAEEVEEGEEAEAEEEAGEEASDGGEKTESK